MLQNPDSASRTAQDAKQQSPDATSAAPPSIALPKGGGAIQGMGEKFAANPATGTGSLTVPIAVSPGRAGFTPGLSLSYDSGSGNGPYGFGWSLDLPTITRKTSKGLPQYIDDAESDVFVLAGAEDLVPVLAADGKRHSDAATAPGYILRRYRPRIEGLFNRIERWTRVCDGDTHWRVWSRDNVLSVYGQDANSRIADPCSGTPRVFSWLLCEKRDDKGNGMRFVYQADDAEGIDTCSPHERNRTARARASNRYIKRIHYGNRRPLLEDGQRPRMFPGFDPDWMFEIVFDYGDHASGAPLPQADRPWPARVDAFSSYRAGFEVRTTRLCRRVLMFHHFPGEPGVGANCLVRSTDLHFSDTSDAIYTFLRAVTHTSYRRQDGRYDQQSLPPVEFEYTRPVVQDKIEDVDPESLENLPIGADGSSYRWTDLHGEGIAGILAEQGGAWFYKRNLSPLSNSAQFAPLEAVALQPNVSLADGASLMDLAGDGVPDVVVMDGPMPGLYEHDASEGWQPFRAFSARLGIDMRDPNLRFIDLDGDGQADALITEDDAFVWHASLGEHGFGPARRVPQAQDEEHGPRIVFADAAQSIFLADLSGDGMADILRVRNGETCYWPNLGYGRFGAKVAMDNPPWFDEVFDPQRLRLADIDGSGTTDMIYLHEDGVRLYFNHSGNGWSDARRLDVFPAIDEMAGIMPADLLGNGTTCLVWSSALPGGAQRPMRFVNLMGGHKPHLLVRSTNNLGAETHLAYAPSTRFYLQDKHAGRPWITRLPFPVHVVERVETWDHVSRNRFVTRYAYHDGYFDGEEREFRGFGMVEQWDSEQFGVSPAANIDPASHVPPIRSKSWFHTGHRLLGRTDYYRQDGLTEQQAWDLQLPDTVLPSGLSWEEEREACRALKGSLLRQEVYADDAGANASASEQARARTPYTVLEQSHAVRTVQARGCNRHAVFFTHGAETLSYHYERNPGDPRIQHTINLKVDEWGNVLRSAAIGYGRRVPADLSEADLAKQAMALLTVTEHRVTGAIEAADTWRHPLPCERAVHELTGCVPSGAAGRFRASDLASGQRRLLKLQRTLYRRDDLGGLLPLGESHSLALTGESYQLAFSAELLARVFQRNGQALLPDPHAVLAVEGGYLPGAFGPKLI